MEKLLRGPGEFPGAGVWGAEYAYRWLEALVLFFVDAYAKFRFSSISF